MSPDATALVGIDWQAVQNTPVADAVEAELWGDMGVPGLPCVHHAHQIVISSPELLALASANCAALRAEARTFRVMNYRGTQMYFATEKGMLSIARLNDQVLMLGQPDTLQAAIDRIAANSKDYSPLLARAAQFNGKDLWVVAAQLPDALADRFVPLKIEATKMDGFVSFRNGLLLQASLGAGSEKNARKTASQLEKDKAAMPSLFHGMTISSDGDVVQLTLDVTRDQALASLAAVKPAAEQPVAKPVEKPVENPKPQVVRIIGLDEGPREIILPPVKNP